MPPRPQLADSSGDPEAARPASEAAEQSVGFRRGDWVRVEGRFLGRVIRVEQDGRRLVVESADDLRQRTIDLRRSRVQRIE